MISPKRLRSGLNRLGVVLGAAITIVTFIKLDIPRPGELGVHIAAAVVAGCLTWAAVRGIAWVIEGFRGPKSN